MRQPWPGRHQPGEPASRWRAWTAGLTDQAVVVAFFLYFFGLALVVPEGTFGGDLSPVLLVTGTVGAVVLVFAECWCLRQRRATIGFWLRGVRGSRHQWIGFDDALEYFFYFWPATVTGVLLAPLTRRDPQPTYVVHDPRSAFSPWARALGWVALLASPVPAVVGIVG